MSSDNSNHLRVGVQLGDFSIVSIAGEGGFSIVYVAEDSVLERKVAIKEYLPTSLAARGRDGVTVHPRSVNSTEGFQAGLRSFIREAKLLAQFSHPAIVDVYQVWEQNGTAYIAMRHLNGETLSDYARNNVVFSEDEMRVVLEPIFGALERLHSENIIHRDVSPDNIILADGKPVLLDLGAARVVVGGLTQALTSVLKPGYAPVEQYTDDGSLKQGPWTDVYAMSGVLYKLATGVTPVQAIARVVGDPLRSLQSIGGNFSEAFAESVMAGLTVFPEHRIKSVSELRERLGWHPISTQVMTTTVVRAVKTPQGTEIVIQTPLSGSASDLHKRASDDDDRVTSDSSHATPSARHALPGTYESVQGRGLPDSIEFTAGSVADASQDTARERSPPSFAPLDPRLPGVASARWRYAAASVLVVSASLIGYRTWFGSSTSAPPTNSSLRAGTASPVGPTDSSPPIAALSVPPQAAATAPAGPRPLPVERSQAVPAKPAVAPAPAAGKPNSEAQRALSQSSATKVSPAPSVAPTVLEPRRPSPSFNGTWLGELDCQASTGPDSNDAKAFRRRVSGIVSGGELMISREGSVREEFSGVVRPDGRIALTGTGYRVADPTYRWKATGSLRADATREPLRMDGSIKLEKTDAWAAVCAVQLTKE